MLYLNISDSFSPNANQANPMYMLYILYILCTLCILHAAHTVHIHIVHIAHTLHSVHTVHVMKRRQIQRMIILNVKGGGRGGNPYGVEPPSSNKNTPVHWCEGPVGWPLAQGAKWLATPTPHAHLPPDRIGGLHDDPPPMRSPGGPSSEPMKQLSQKSRGKRPGARSTVC